MNSFNDSQLSDSTDVSYETTDVSYWTDEIDSIDSQDEFLSNPRKRSRYEYTNSVNLSYLERSFNIFSFDHIEQFFINSDKNHNIGFLCSIKDDRLKILTENIIRWITNGFDCYLFFSSLSEKKCIETFIEKIKENEEIMINIEKIKYVIYSYSTLMDNSAGTARISAFLFFNKYFKENDELVFVISDDRRLTEFSNFDKTLEEILDNQILFPQSQMSSARKKAKSFGKKKPKTETTFCTNKLGQVYICNSQTIQKICTDKKILTCMSASIFEDYILLHLDINIKISRHCNRYNYGDQKSIARNNDITDKEIFELLNPNNSKGYFLNIILSIITQKDIKKYSGYGFDLHKRILDIYLQ